MKEEFEYKEKTPEEIAEEFYEVAKRDLKRDYGLDDDNMTILEKRKLQMIRDDYAREYRNAKHLSSFNYGGGSEILFRFLREEYGIDLTNYMELLWGNRTSSESDDKFRELIDQKVKDQISQVRQEREGALNWEKEREKNNNN